jgi:hypothetical protein
VFQVDVSIVSIEIVLVVTVKSHLKFDAMRTCTTGKCPVPHGGGVEKHHVW